MNRRLSVLVALLATAVVACNETGTDLEGPGTFDAEVTGELETSINGSAIYGPSSGTASGAGFVLSLISRETSGGRPRQVILFVDEGGEQPEVGTTVLLDEHAWSETALEETFPPDLYAIFANFVGDLVPLYTSTGGELVVTESTGSRLRGSFDFPARFIHETDTSTDTLDVVVSGTFEALPGTPEIAF